MGPVNAKGGTRSAEGGSWDAEAPWLLPSWGASSGRDGQGESATIAWASGAGPGNSRRRMSRAFSRIADSSSGAAGRFSLGSWSRRSAGGRPVSRGDRDGIIGVTCFGFIRLRTAPVGSIRAATCRVSSEIRTLQNCRIPRPRSPVLCHAPSRSTYPWTVPATRRGPQSIRSVRTPTPGPRAPCRCHFRL